MLASARNVRLNRGRHVAIMIWVEIVLLGIVFLTHWKLIRLVWRWLWIVVQISTFIDFLLFVIVVVVVALALHSLGAWLSVNADDFPVSARDWIWSVIYELLWSCEPPEVMLMLQGFLLWIHFLVCFDLFVPWRCSGLFIDLQLSAIASIHRQFY